MGEIIIKHRAGGETKLQSKQATVKITRAEQRKQLLGEDTFNITLQSAQPIEIFIGDRIEIFGSVYTINQLPTVKKTGTRVFEQTIILEGTQYELLDVQFILPGNTMYDNLTGDLDDFIDVLLYNANRIYPGKWTKGAVPENTETKTLSFSERNCLEALQTLCEEYSTEFEIVVSTTGTRTLHIKQVGLQFPFPFTYGRTGGLYQLTRQNVNSQSVVTRLYVYGGSSNLGSSYRYSKLCLPGKEKNDSYIEDEIAVGLYGVKENTKTFSDIFPARVGSITALGSEYFAFVDNTMFDLNEKEADGETTKWLIPGVGAKIRMQTGNLAGYEFDVHAYDHGTFELQVVPFIDESGFKFPSETNAAFQFKVGDKYIFTDINLPDSYITDAEAKLETEGEKHYNKYRQPQVQYSLAIHPRFLEKYAGAPETISNIFALGDQIQVIDDDIGVNKSLRITGFTRDALDPYRYTLTLSEAAYSKTIINRIISDIKDITDIIELNNLADPSKARRNWMAAQELLNKIFDPEGYYYSEKIKPLSIETSMLAVGARSQQFTLKNVQFEPNYEGNPNKIMISAGQLIHYTIEDTIRTWEIAQGSSIRLVSNTAYYIYARCSKTTAAGNIILATTQRKVDYEEGYYTFMIGVLNSVPDDGLRPARLISLTYGASTINGRFIKTGRIESSGGGSTYFDLDEGIIGGRIRFLSNGAETDLSDWADQILAELGDVDGVITDLEEYIDGTFKDGIIDEAEAKAIEKYINQINKEKNELEVVYYNTINNPLLPTAPRYALINAKITLFGVIASLLNTINTAIADGATTPAEKQAVDAAFATYSSSLDLFATRLEEARISIEQYLKGEADGARDAAAAAQAAANAASQDVEDISGIVDDLDIYIDGAFHDGVVEEAEAKSIEKYLNSLSETKLTVDSAYTQVYNNSYLEGSAKTNLESAKTALNDAYTNLVNSINTAIAGGSTTAAQKDDVDAKFALFNTALATYQVRVEEANKAIQDKLKSFSDEAKAKAAQADYLRAALQQSTEIDGGVVLGSVIAGRDAYGQVRSYQNGDPELNNTAFAAGVHDFGTEDETRTVGLNHDGSADIGVLRVTPEGKVVLVDPSTGDERLIFLEQDLPTVEDLRASTTDGGSRTNVARSGSNTFTLPNTMIVAKNNSNITVVAAEVKISGSTGTGDPGTGGPVPQNRLRVEVDLLRNGVHYALIGSRSLHFQTSVQYLEDTFSIDRVFTGCPAGTYSIKVSVLPSGDIASRLASISASTMSWAFNQDVNWFQFGLNGFMAWFTNNAIHFDEQNGFFAKGKTDMPGVLLGATVLSTGGFLNWWGAKKHATLTATKNSAGKYTVYHRIGHSNYQVVATPSTASKSSHVVSKSNDNFVIEWRTIGSTPALSDTGFDFQITGNNN